MSLSTVETENKQVYTLSQRKGRAPQPSITLGGQPMGGGPMTTTRTWLHKADSTYSRARPKNLAGVFVWNTCKPLRMTRPVCYLKHIKATARCHVLQNWSTKYGSARLASVNDSQFVFVFCSRWIKKEKGERQGRLSASRLQPRGLKHAQGKKNRRGFNYQHWKTLNSPFPENTNFLGSMFWVKQTSPPPSSTNKMNFPFSSYTRHKKKKKKNVVWSIFLLFLLFLHSFSTKINRVFWQK